MTNLRFPSAGPGPEAGPGSPTVNWDEVQMPKAPPVQAGAEPVSTEQTQEQGEPIYLVDGIGIDINDGVEVKALAEILGVTPEEVKDRLEQGLQAGERGATLWNRLTPEAQERHRAEAKAAAKSADVDESTPEPLLTRSVLTPPAAPAPARDVKMRVVGANDGETQVIPAVPSHPAKRVVKKTHRPAATPATPATPDLAKPTDGQATGTEAPKFYKRTDNKAAEKFFTKKKHHDKVLTEEQFREFFGDDAIAADPDLKAEYQSVHPVYLYSPEERSMGSYRAIHERDNVLGWRRDTIRDEHGNKIKLPPSLVPEDSITPDIDNTPVVRRRKRDVSPTEPAAEIPKILRDDDEPAAEPAEAKASVSDTPEPLGREDVYAYFAQKEKELAQKEEEFLARMESLFDSKMATFDSQVEAEVQRRLAELGVQVAGNPQVAPEVTAAQAVVEQTAGAENDADSAETTAASKATEKRRRQLVRAAKVAGVAAIAGMGVAVAAVRQHNR
ncbi:MAG: hypothetical protein QG553_27 [Patescibacteria group bacterium]|nr:hypothetical protein [Patescibacteria group bacterium]